MLAAVLQLPSLIFGIAFIFASMRTLGDIAPLYIILTLVELVKGIVGWVFLAFFIYKYRKLNNLN